MRKKIYQLWSNKRWCTTSVAENFERLLLLTMAVAITPKQWRRTWRKISSGQSSFSHTNLGYGAALKLALPLPSMTGSFLLMLICSLIWLSSDNFWRLPTNTKPLLAIGQRAEGFEARAQCLPVQIIRQSLFRVHVRDIDCAFKLFRTWAHSPLKLQSMAPLFLLSCSI